MLTKFKHFFNFLQIFQIHNNLQKLPTCKKTQKTPKIIRKFGVFGKIFRLAI